MCFGDSGFKVLGFVLWGFRFRFLGFVLWGFKGLGFWALCFGGLEFRVEGFGGFKV